VPETSPNPNAIQNPEQGLPTTEGARQLPLVTGRRKTVDRRELSADPPENLEADRRMPDDRRQSRQKMPTSNPPKKEGKHPVDQNAIRLAQHRRKRLLAECEAIMSVQYDTLAMDEYPESALIAAARQDRDYWMFITACMALLFMLGLPGWLPEWLAGSALGLSFLSWIFAFSPWRSHFFSRPVLSELLQKRKELEFRALSHIRLLEANGGLAWRCRAMSDYNSNLRRRLFQGVVRFSAEHSLLSILKSRKHIRLYLLYALEAQKAYQIMQQTYLKLHFRNLEQGWDDGITDAEAEKLTSETETEQNVQQ